MMFYYRVVSTGEVLGAAHSSAQDDDWLQRYAEALGINESIEEFSANNDPRPIDARREPAPDVDIAPTPLDQIKAALIADPGLAKETKAAIEAVQA